MNGTKILAGASITIAGLIVQVVGLGHIEAQQVSAVSVLEALAKEHKAYDAQVGLMKYEEKKVSDKKQSLDRETERIGKEDRDIQRRATELDLEQKALADGPKTRWSNQGCVAGQSSTDRAFVESCNAMARQISKQQEDINSQVLKLVDRAKTLKADREQLSADTLQWTADTKRVAGELDRLRGVLKAQEARFNVCSLDLRTASTEEIKHKCGNVQFDRARPNLPSCDTPACAQFDRLARRR